MWEAVTAIAAVAAILVGAWTIVADGMRTRRVLKVDILTRQLDRFESPAFEALRTKAALSILGKAPDVDDGMRSLDAVLNFFETMAFYQRRGALDYDAIWQTFSAWLLPYCIGAAPYIERLQERDRTSYEELSRLQAQLERIEQRRGGLFALSESSRIDHAKRHLHYEARLPLPETPRTEQLPSQ